MKKVQSAKPNMLPKERTTKPFDEFWDHFEFKSKPVSDRWLDNLSVELVHWATAKKKNMRDEALTMTEFFSDKGIGSSDVKRWRTRYAPFNSAYVFALERIGTRREKGAVVKDFDGGTVRTSMPKYESKEMNWTELEEWRSHMSAKEAGQASGKIEVYLDSFKEKQDDNNGTTDGGASDPS